MARPIPNPNPGNLSWLYQLRNTTSPTQARQIAADADRVFRQQQGQSASAAEDQAYRERISKARMAEQRQMDQQRLTRSQNAMLQGRAEQAMRDYFKEQENAKSWEQRKADEAKAQKDLQKMLKADQRAARSSAIKNLLSKFRGGPGALGALMLVPSLLEGGNILSGRTSVDPELGEMK